MDRGSTFSGIGHAGLILWVALGDWLFAPADMPPIAVAQVSLISESDFKALQASAPKAAKPADKPAVAAPAALQPDLPAAEPLPEPTPKPKPEPVPAPTPEPLPTPQPAPDPAPVPDVPADAPVAADPQPIAVPDPVAPLAAEEQTVPVPQSSVRPKPRPIDRVAAVPVDPAPDAPEVADTITPEVTDQPAPDAPAVEEPVQPAASPEAATTQIATEENQTDENAPQLAPTASVRPQSRPQRAAEIPATDLAVDTPAETPLDSSAEATDPQADEIAAALAAAAAEAPAAETADAGAPDVPEGPPMSAGEVEGLRVAINKCWNVGQLSSEALRVTVTMRVEMQENGKPNSNSIEMTGYEGGSEGAALQAFEAGRRAIIRCAKDGYELAPEKYGQWNVLNLIFDPSGMRLR